MSSESILKKKLPSLPRDGHILFATRIIRLFAYGSMSVVLALYLVSGGFTKQEVGRLISFTLLGDVLVTLFISTTADRLGRRRMLLAGAGLMILAGLVFAFTRNPILLIIAAFIGIVSPNGNEIGPFLSLEQASLTDVIPASSRTQVFAWYNLAGSFATALGALAGGNLANALQRAGWSDWASYRVVIFAYAAMGLVLAILFLFVSPQVEVKTQDSGVQQVKKPMFGLHKSKAVVFRLAGLFSIDAFGGGFVGQSIMILWFAARWHADSAMLGNIFFWANLLAGISALSASWVADKIGLIKTMVFTHLPSNILLMLVPLMPSLPLAIIVLLLRFSISQMDVPTRQSYTMAVVDPDERSAAAGVTSIARSIGASISPTLAGMLIANPLLMGVPFLIGGGLKIIYDLTLYRMFVTIKPPEEAGQTETSVNKAVQ
ncbi:MAG: MFS transporter [Chloroflexi bacterium]|nr:MFS transporter [Chloroflexota bacterium]